MLRRRKRIVPGGGGRIDDGGAPMAVAGGNEGRGEIVAEQRDIVSEVVMVESVER